METRTYNENGGTISESTGTISEFIKAAVNKTAYVRMAGDGSAYIKVTKDALKKAIKDVKFIAWFTISAEPIYVWIKFIHK